MTGTVKQVLMLKFKDSVSPEQQASLVEKYEALKNSISVLKGFEWGTDLSAENMHQGYTHVFIATFESAEARQEYLVHPDHQAYANELRAAVDNIIIFPFATTVTLKPQF